MQCRACMRIDRDLVKMVSIVSKDNKTLYDYYNVCTQLNASPNDTLPNVLCTICSEEVQAAFTFRKKALKSDEEFRKVLGKVEQVLPYSHVEAQMEVLQEIEEPKHDPLYVSELIEHESMPAILSNASEGVHDLFENNIKTEPTVEVCDNEPNDDQILCDNSEKIIQDVGENFAKDKLNTSATHTVSITNNKATSDCTISKKRYKVKKSFQAHRRMKHTKQTNSKAKCKTITEPIENESAAKILSNSNEKVHDLPEKDIKTESTMEVCDNEPNDEEILCDNSEKLKDKLKSSDNSEKLIQDIGENVAKDKLKSSDNSEKLIQDENVAKDKLKSSATHTKVVEQIASDTDTNNETTYDCPVCKKQYTLRKSYMQHIRKKHGPNSKTPIAEPIEDESTYCTHCKKQYNGRKSYLQHIRMRHRVVDTKNKKKFECMICKKQYKIRKSMQIHIRINHPVPELDSIGDAAKQTNSEAECSKTTSLEEGEKECAKNVDENVGMERKYICSVCPREFPSRISVRAHERNTHFRAEKIVECTYCYKRFKSNYIKIHVNLVHIANSKIVCDICGNSFKSYLNLQLHKKFHLERKFSCTLCDKKLVSKTDLKVHMRYHTGESPFACNLCDKRFKTRSFLNYHLEKHAGIKKKCKECGKEFRDINQLRIHSYKHTGMPYRCTVCNYGCPIREVLRKHLLRVHNKTLTDAEYHAMFKANTGRIPVIPVISTVEKVQTEAEQTKD